LILDKCPRTCYIDIWLRYCYIVTTVIDITIVLLDIDIAKRRRETKRKKGRKQKLILPGISAQELEHYSESSHLARLRNSQISGIDPVNMHALTQYGGLYSAIGKGPSPQKIRMNLVPALRAAPKSAKRNRKPGTFRRCSQTKTNPLAVSSKVNNGKKAKYN
jgi:hypothetical protein